jgi:glycosyltransferase involved in cell wall biosynthesis
VGSRFYLSLLANLVDRDPYLVSRHRCLALGRRIAALLQQESFDVVHCDWTPLMANVPEWAHAQTALTAHNIEAEIWQGYLRTSRSAIRVPYISHQLRKLQRFERLALRSAGIVVTVCERDADLARAWYGCERLAVVCNGVDTTFFQSAGISERAGRLLYTGSMDTIANADAVVWLVSQILPLIAERRPEVTLDIVGRDPTPAVRQLANHPRVSVTGGVEDVRPYYGRAQVVVVPLRVGGGTRLKILEAWAMSKAVVATSLGCAGLDAVHGRDVLLADYPAPFAQAVTHLLGDRPAREAMGKAGRENAVRNYDWGAPAECLEAAWQEMASMHKVGGARR